MKTFTYGNTLYFTKFIIKIRVANDGLYVRFVDGDQVWIPSKEVSLVKELLNFGEK